MRPSPQEASSAMSSTKCSLTRSGVGTCLGLRFLRAFRSTRVGLNASSYDSYLSKSSLRYEWVELVDNVGFLAITHTRIAGRPDGDPCAGIRERGGIETSASLVSRAGRVRLMCGEAIQFEVIRGRSANLAESRRTLRDKNFDLGCHVERLLSCVSIAAPKCSREVWNCQTNRYPGPGAQHAATAGVRCC